MNKFTIIGTGSVAPLSHTYGAQASLHKHHQTDKGCEKMRRMNKPSRNKTERLILGYPTAYKGTPRASFAYSTNRKSKAFAIVLCVLMFKGLLRIFHRSPIILVYAVCTFLQTLDYRINLILIY